MNKLKMLKPLASIIFAGIIFSGTAQAAENRVVVSEQNYSRLFGQDEWEEFKNDPELAEIMKNFVYGDIYNQVNLPDKERQLVTIAVLAAHQNKDLLRRNVEAALKIGVTPYMGFPRAFDALKVINSVFEEKGIKLPLQNQATLTEENRVEKGFAIRKNIYGERITNSIKNSPPDTCTFKTTCRDLVSATLTREAHWI